MKNLKEFKELIERYESITIEEIEATGDFVIDDAFIRGLLKQSTINKLTGFGTKKSCKLCSAIENDFCEGCVYDIGKNNLGVSCTIDQFEESFNLIRDAENAEELLLAIKKRAIVMREHLKTI